MKANNRSPANSALDEAAAEWLYEREEGFTAARAKAFAEWCNRDPRHAQAVTRMERTLALLDEMPAFRVPLESRVAIVRAESTPRRTGRIIPLPRLAWIAGLAAMLVVGLTIWWGDVFRPVTPDGEHYATDTTAQRSLVLTDGSVMDINIGSDVSLRFTAAERRVNLIKGEAHFQVVHDAARPFIVVADGVSVRAVGTVFNVRLVTNAVDVLVVEGKIELVREHEPRATIAPPLLHAGERTHLLRGDPSFAPKIEKLDPAAIRDLLTWQTPMTNFGDVPLREVIARFNHRNITKLVLEDVDLGERKIGGLIALDQVDAFVRLLERDGDIVADRRTAGQIGLRRAR
jgi:transmembrane sensor